MRRFEIIILGLMFLFLALALPAQAAGNDNLSKIICNGEGKATAAPDVITITLGVETRNVSASAAAALNAKLMNSTINALLSAGLKKRDVQTSHYSLTTQTEENPVPVGAAKNKTPLEFVATNQVTARMNVSENIGKVLDAATAAGSNNVMGISFDLRDPKPQMDKALAQAVNDSRRKAEIMAMAAGVKLGKILELSEGYGYTSSNAPRAAFSLSAAPTPVLPGEMEITSSVTVTYEIIKQS